MRDSARLLEELASDARERALRSRSDPQQPPVASDDLITAALGPKHCVLAAELRLHLSDAVLRSRACGSPALLHDEKLARAAEPSTARYGAASGTGSQVLNDLSPVGGPRYATLTPCEVLVTRFASAFNTYGKNGRNGRRSPAVNGQT